MVSLQAREACLRLADDLEQHWSLGEDLNRRHTEIISTLRSQTDDGIDAKHGITAFMPALARHVEEIIKEGQPEQFKAAMLRTLADATREVPFWRPLFGLETKPDHAVNLKQMKRGSAPDSILEVARRTISGQIPGSSSEQTRCALRIIANCCADNDVNRSIVINRDGIEEMLEIVRHKQECDLVIPTLYNVCIDYDEPATDVHGKPWGPLPQMQAAGTEVSSVSALSAAEQRLGTYWFPYENKTSFEILLKAMDDAESCRGTLADLLEMASRVALFGMDKFVQEHDGNEPGDIIQVDTTADIVRLLLTIGVDLAKEDIDCHVSICQAVLNILSQQDSHAAVMNSDGALWKLINLPYVLNTDDDEEQAIVPYRQAILKLAYEISATEAYAQTFNEESTLIRNCINSLDSFLDIPYTSTQSSASDPLAASCVLLANCITTTERAERLLRSTQVALILCLLFVKTSDPEVLLPGVDLAARLALCREGQDAMCSDEVRTLSAIAKVLHDRISEVDATGLEVQRNAVALARLLIKGRSQNIRQFTIYPSRVDISQKDLSQSTHLAGELYHLYDRTNDTQTKIEMGRLMIEVLRTIYSSIGLSTAQFIAPASGSGTDDTGTKNAESYFLGIFGDHGPSISTPTAKSTPIFKGTVTEMISYILTQPQLQPPTGVPAKPNVQAEAEAWFGLALLSTMSSTHSSIRAALARADYQLLNRLRAIVCQHASPEKDNGDIGAGEPQEKSIDPRYENIKVLVVKMLQIQPPSDDENQGQRLSGEEKLVQAGLEAAAAEVGLDWVIV